MSVETKSNKAANGQDRDIKNLSQQVRYWKYEATDYRKQLSECERKRKNMFENYTQTTNVPIEELVSRAEKSESVLLDREKDFNDLKIILGEKDVVIRELKQKCDSFENVNKTLKSNYEDAGRSVAYWQDKFTKSDADFVLESRFLNSCEKALEIREKQVSKIRTSLGAFVFIAILEALILGLMLV